jgi:hypothetical protein
MSAVDPKVDSFLAGTQSPLSADCVEKLQIWVVSNLVPREQELALSFLMQRLA